MTGRARFLTSFPVKLAALFLILVVLAGGTSLVLALRLFEARQGEIDQRLNAGIAASMASEIEPLALTGSSAEIGPVIHYMMVLNPAVEIYLLDDTGRILEYFATPGPAVELERVDVDPILAFLESDRELPILGDNPRRPSQRAYFSVAPVDLDDGDAGFLYVVLHSSGYDTASMELQQAYLLRAIRSSALITIPLIAIVGLVGFLLSTRPLGKLTQAVAAFGRGDYAVRSSIETRDEIGELARNFNVMADTIVRNMERLRYADRERRELIANISHDLRNPLATVQGYLETLAERDAGLDPAERRRYYEILLSSIRSVPRLVDDLFELSKLDDPDARPHVEPFSLSELVQDVVVGWRERALDQGIRIEADEPDGLFLVEGDVAMIERLLDNLIRNAIAHTPRDGRVTVAVERRDAAVRVTVSDTGRGIATGDVERVFDRFYIGDRSRTRSREGSGLGLAICKRIVEIHGGTIGVESAAGQGSKFHFELRLAEAATN